MDPSGRSWPARWTGPASTRERYLAAIREYSVLGRQARTWPLQFLVRRTAHHAMDHAWEMEGRDLTERDG